MTDVLATDTPVQGGFGLEWVIFVALFIAIEGQALVKRDHRGTLTAHVRRWASLEGKGPWWQARRAALVGFLAWLVLHLVFPAGSF